MTFDINLVDRTKLNVITQYPRIPNYHRHDEKGRPTPELEVDFGDEPVIATELINGVHARLVVFPGGYVIGDRYSHLYFYGSEEVNNRLGIVRILKPLADRIWQGHVSTCLTVYYFEVFGGTINEASRNYTGRARLAYRLIDCALIPKYDLLLTKTVGEIEKYKAEEGYVFLEEYSLSSVAMHLGIEMAPGMFELNIDNALPIYITKLPPDLKETYKMLSTFSASVCVLDSHAKGLSEGLILRTPKRDKIAKLRLEEYEKIRRPKLGELILALKGRAL